MDMPLQPLRQNMARIMINEALQILNDLLSFLDNLFD